MKKFYMMAMLVAAMGLTACGHKGDQGDAGTPGAPGPTGPAAPVAPPVVVDEVQADINALVADENDYRISLGQTMLSEGLSCKLYTTTGGDRIQASIAGHNTLQGLTQIASFTYKGQDAATTFQQYDASVNDGLNVLPTPLKNTYKNAFLLRCEGQIVITETGLYGFELYSDDASLLYIDGSKLIDNDNSHGITLMQGNKNLRRGVHTFRLDFAQTGGGNQALVLRANGVSIPPRFFQH